MNKKRPSVPQPKGNRPAIDKVSVLLPRALSKRIRQMAKQDRRAMSPQIVLLIEAALAARELPADFPA